LSKIVIYDQNITTGNSQKEIDTNLITIIIIVQIILVFNLSITFISGGISMRKVSNFQSNNVLKFLFYDEKKANEAEAILKIINRCKKVLDNAVQGQIQITGANDYKQFKYSCNCDGQQVKRYLSKRKEEKLITELAQKRYVEKLLVCLNTEIELINIGATAINSHNKYNVYQTMPESLKKFVVPYYPSAEYINSLWDKQEWTCYNKYNEEKIHKTNRGEYVRSKSEKIIADLLDSYQELDYVYEPELFLKGLNYPIHPDFVVINRKTGKLYIWEHAGMIGEINYSSDFIRKYNEYDSAGIFIGVNLFITMENERVPYDVDRGYSICQRILADSTW